jgi:cell division protein FtsL
VKQRPFLALWTLATLATVVAFIVHLGLRGRTVDLGYKLGRARAEQARLREVKRVLSLEAASFETPQRVEHVAQSLLGMSPPPPERVIALRGFSPTAPDEDKIDEASAPPSPSGSGSTPPAPATDGGAP